MRRILATLLVVASPVALAGPVAAREPSAVAGVIAAPLPPVAAPEPAAPMLVPAAVVPAMPGPLATPVRAATAPGRVVTDTRRAVRPSAAGVRDAVYTAHLQADLCQARPVFCGLDQGGRYPGS